jgi:mono/diheme cytochrome c family protein
MTTPVGTVYSTNITPDAETGIGQWSEADFRRAMHEGVARDGRHLYPVFPYDHFTHVSDEDVSALYAFFMTRDPVRAETPENRMIFPLNVRGMMAGWDMLYLHPGPWQPDPSRSAEWNRGAYLAEGLAHCGACHTPRDMFLHEERDRAYAGSLVDGWDAPPLDGKSPAARPWSEQELFEYLWRGGDDHHGSAAGPMEDVTHNLSQAPEADVRAIAVYFASRMKGAARSQTPPAPGRGDERMAATEASGAAIFAGACAECHGLDSPRILAGRPLLGVTTSINADSPRNAIRYVLYGLEQKQGARGAYMPGFDAILSDDQVADVLAYVRTRYSGRPAWRDLAQEVDNIRNGR